MSPAAPHALPLAEVHACCSQIRDGADEADARERGDAIEQEGCGDVSEEQRQAARHAPMYVRRTRFDSTLRMPMPRPALVSDQRSTTLVRICRASQRAVVLPPCLLAALPRLQVGSAATGCQLAAMLQAAVVRSPLCRTGPFSLLCRTGRLSAHSPSRSSPSASSPHPPCGPRPAPSSRARARRRRTPS